MDESDWQHEAELLAGAIALDLQNRADLGNDAANRLLREALDEFSVRHTGTLLLERCWCEHERWQHSDPKLRGADEDENDDGSEYCAVKGCVCPEFTLG